MFLHKHLPMWNLCWYIFAFKKITFFFLEVVKTTFMYALLHYLSCFQRKKKCCLLSRLAFTLSLQHYLHIYLAEKDEEAEVKQIDTAEPYRFRKKMRESSLNIYYCTLNGDEHNINYPPNVSVCTATCGQLIPWFGCGWSIAYMLT